MNCNDYHKIDARSGPLWVGNCLTYASFDPFELIYLCAPCATGCPAAVTSATLAFVCEVQYAGNVDVEWCAVEALLELKPIGHGDAAQRAVHEPTVQSLMVAMVWPLARTLDAHLSLRFQFLLAFELHSTEDLLLLCCYFGRKSWSLAINFVEFE